MSGRRGPHWWQRLVPRYGNWGGPGLTAYSVDRCPIVLATAAEASAFQGAFQGALHVADQALLRVGGVAKAQIDAAPDEAAV